MVVQLDRGSRGELTQLGAVFEIGAALQREQGDRSIQGSRVEVGETEAPRHAAGNSALPAAGGTVDRDDHRGEA
jgi:hypothetical protein